MKLPNNRGTSNMAKALGNAERPTGLQNADSAVPATPGQQRSAPFARYWHKPATPTPSMSEKAPQTTAASSDINVLQCPISSSAVTTIELLKSEPAEVVELQSSDEDEVVEVALPPKPTITIESSDEEEITPVVIEPAASTPQSKTQPQELAAEKNVRKKQKNKRRAASTSPVPSVVSSISDDFIRGDCLAFNITRRPEVERFDFRLHGTDLIEQHSNKLDQANTPVSQKKKKRNKKSKEKPTPAPRPEPPSPQTQSPDLTEHSFSTPRSSRRTGNNYTVNESSVPCADVYESDSNQSALIESATENISAQINMSSETEIISTVVQTVPSTEPTPEEPIPETAGTADADLIDITSREEVVTQDPIPVEDNLVMGNVSGLEPATQPVRAPKPIPKKDTPRARSVSSGTPRVASDVDNIIHNSKESCREEMERFYNESWGGEDFNHFDIQRSMPRDRSLWAIDPRDKIIPSNTKRRCHYCNQVGHAYDRCRFKPRICHMCGTEGHCEPRCPERMCLRCGSPNGIYSVYCRNCAHWSRVFCEVCQTYGHPVNHCPDLWRRYHNTVENDGILMKQSWRKRREELFCSACTRRGHLAHTCRQLPFSNLPLASPFVFQYWPVFPPKSYPQYPTVSPAGRYFTMPDDGAGTNSVSYNQQQAEYYQHTQVPILSNIDKDTPKPKTPNPDDQTLHNRRSSSDVTNQADPKNDARDLKRHAQTSNDPISNKRRSLSTSEVTNQTDEKIDSSAVSSTTNNRVLQDSEVSNTSDVVTTAKIFIEKSVMEELKKKEGADWLQVVSAQNRVEVTVEESPTTFVLIKGLPEDQEGFQNELREFVKKVNGVDTASAPADVTDTSQIKDEDDFTKDIPQKKYKALRMLNQALGYLQSDLGDPKAIYREFLYLQNNHKKLLKQDVISPKKLRNSRHKLNVILKTLNTILLGQAGLGDGSRHVRELYALQAVLSKYRKSTLPQELRSRVGENYHFIFSTVARNDYANLMSKYYNRCDARPINQNTPNKTLSRKAKQQLKKKDHNYGEETAQKDGNEQTIDQIKTRVKKLLKKTPIKSSGKKMKKLRKLLKKKNQDQSQGEEVVNIKETNNKQQGIDRTVDQIQSCQKKLRKEKGGDEQKKQWRAVLLTRLLKFQVQMKRRGLFPNQHVQLRKLFTEVNTFCGES